MFSQLFSQSVFRAEDLKFKSRPGKSDTVSQTARFRCNISWKGDDVVFSEETRTGPVLHRYRFVSRYE